MMTTHQVPNLRQIGRECGFGLKNPCGWQVRLQRFGLENKKHECLTISHDVHGVRTRGYDRPLGLPMGSCVYTEHAYILIYNLYNVHVHVQYCSVAVITWLGCTISTCFVVTLCMLKLHVVMLSVAAVGVSVP